jgi:hypothetical protein
VWKSRKTGVLVALAIFTLNWLDMFNTWYLISTKCSYEESPYMASLIELGWNHFYSIKTWWGLLAFFVIAFSWSDYRKARVGGVIVLVVYIGVTSYSIYNTFLC